VTTPSDSRPKLVSIAYWLWLVAAIALFLFGILAASANGDSIRERLADLDYSTETADAFVLMLRVTGGMSVVVGLAIGFMAGPVRNGHYRFRRALVALSAIFALFQAGAVLTGISPVILLVVPVLLVAASVLVYRPGAKEWFVDET